MIQRVGPWIGLVMAGLPVLDPDTTSELSLSRLVAMGETTIDMFNRLKSCSNTLKKILVFFLDLG